MRYHVFYRADDSWHRYTSRNTLAEAEADAATVMMIRAVTQTRIIPFEGMYETPNAPTD